MSDYVPLEAFAVIGQVQQPHVAEIGHRAQVTVSFKFRQARVPELGRNKYRTVCDSGNELTDEVSRRGYGCPRRDRHTGSYGLRAVTQT